MLLFYEKTIMRGQHSIELARLKKERRFCLFYMFLAYKMQLSFLRFFLYIFCIFVRVLCVHAALHIRSTDSMISVEMRV